MCKREMQGKKEKVYEEGREGEKVLYIETSQLFCYKYIAMSLFCFSIYKSDYVENN